MASAGGTDAETPKGPLFSMLYSQLYVGREVRSKKGARRGVITFPGFVDSRDLRYVLTIQWDDADPPLEYVEPHELHIMDNFSNEPGLVPQQILDLQAANWQDASGSMRDALGAAYARSRQPVSAQKQLGPLEPLKQLTGMAPPQKPALRPKIEPRAKAAGAEQQPVASAKKRQASTPAPEKAPKQQRRASRGEDKTDDADDDPETEEVAADEEAVEVWTGIRVPTRIANQPGDIPAHEQDNEDDEETGEYEVQGVMDEYTTPKNQKGGGQRWLLVKWKGFELLPGLGPEYLHEVGYEKGHWEPEGHVSTFLRNKWRNEKPAWWVAADQLRAQQGAAGDQGQGGEKKKRGRPKGSGRKAKP